MIDTDASAKKGKQYWLSVFDKEAIERAVQIMEKTDARCPVEPPGGDGLPRSGNRGEIRVQAPGAPSRASSRMTLARLKKGIDRLCCNLRSGLARLRRMMKHLRIFLHVVLTSLLTAIISSGQQPKSLFYLTRDPKSVHSFLTHADKIDILVPNWYSIDSSGLLSGGPDPLVLESARQHHVALMPLVVNAGFAQEEVHKLLVNTAARHQLFGAMIRACKDNSYIGFQLDFENVNWTDRDVLSDLVREVAATFHKENLQLSIATIPNAPGFPGETAFSAWMYQNWRGAYDLKAIAASVDFLCLMTYDQHTVWTVPGPVAGWAWTVANLDYALKVLPPQKIALGIPIYGYRWFSGTPIKVSDKTGDRPNPTAEYISTEDALGLAKAYGGHLEWDPVDRCAWLYFYRDDVREWIFYTDVRTFQERYALAQDRGLYGFASWVLGMEDAGIWDQLPAHK